jgi:protocatechuate 3,4-dioxygenase beta subunit
MATYSIGDLGRRELLMMAAVLTGSGAVAAAIAAHAAPALQRTPGQILGPFYPLTTFPRTSDLTRVPGRSGPASGQVINVTGQVLSLSGEPVGHAEIEVWQANSYGRYRHPRDTNPAPLDPNFDGFAMLTSDAEGRYRFKTIKPGAYPAGPKLIRPSHIHLQVTGRRDRLVTQMYFDGDPHNATDPLLNSAALKDLLIIKMRDPSPEFEPGSKMMIFDIVLLDG